MITVLVSILIIAMLLATVRVVLGPTLADRVVALDLIIAAATGLLILFSIPFHSQLIFDVAIVLALVSFVGTIAFGRYLERKGEA